MATVPPAEIVALRDRFFAMSADIMAIARLDGTLVDVNPAFERLLGWHRDDVVGASIARLIHPEDAEATRAEIAKVFRGTSSDTGWVNRYRCRDGSYRQLRWSTLADPEHGLMFGIARDVSADRALDERLTFHAHHDALTGLANRRLFHDTLQAAVAAADEDRHSAGLLVADLDGFKAVNDRSGHEAGDEVLVAVARRLRGVVREGDLVARLGGDEFAVVMGTLPEDADRARALVDGVAERLDASLGEALTVQRERHVLGVSVGSALHPHEARGADELLRLADRRMYERKRRGRR